MKPLKISTSSVRIPITDGEEKKNFTAAQMQDKVKLGISSGSIANTVLVICGHNPIAHRWGLDEIWRTDNPIYWAIKNAEIRFKFEYVVREVGTIFKCEGEDTGSSTVGVYDKRWFHHVYARSEKGAADYNPNLVDEFEEWLKNRYPNDKLGVFSSLMKRFDEEVTCAKHKTVKDQWPKDNLPSKFHSLTYLMKDSYYGVSGKFWTRPYFYKSGGTVMEKKERGSVVMVGGPRHMITSNFELEIILPDEIYYEIERDRTGGPGYATIGDSGLAWITE